MAALAAMTVLATLPSIQLAPLPGTPGMHEERAITAVEALLPLLTGPSNKN